MQTVRNQITETSPSALAEKAAEALARPSSRLNFPAELERTFIASHDEQHARTNRLFALLGALFILISGVNDFWAMPDQAWLTILLRAGALLLASLAVVAMAVRTMVPAVGSLYPTLLVLFSLYSQATLLFITGVAAEHLHFSYQLGPLLLLLFICLLTRLRFQVTLIIVICMWYMQYFATSLWIRLPAEQSLYVMLVYSVLSVIVLLANYRFERESRRVFLQDLLLATEREELKAARVQIEQLSLADDLTGIGNRRHFDRQLSHEWLRAKRGRQSVSLLLFDIDAFTHYNEQYDRATGDRTLIQVAETIQQKARRQSDLLCRYSSEQFALLTPDMNPADALLLARSIVDSVLALKLPHEGSPQHAVVTISCGCMTLWPHKQPDIKDLIQGADRNLREAKRAGGNQVEASSTNGAAH
ncbi:GGDEF domain-containing protein [Allohahella sp. A8]|uniref:GGDEF domain-containing protein n=1 Tax=Allohahella sp. A8 TaxID=3141461 RepID=UPI000C09FB2B|nr:hypothetical protein [Hahellaceae bacterium]